MEHKSSEPRRAYKGRFGEGSVSAHGRPTGSFRTQPSGTYKSRPEYVRTRGNSEYVPARGYTPPKRGRAAEEPKQLKIPEAAAPKRNTRKRRVPTGIIIAIAVAIVLAAVLILTLSGRAPTHMLPTVTPPETADAATGAEA